MASKVLQTDAESLTHRLLDDVAGLAEWQEATLACRQQRSVVAWHHLRMLFAELDPSLASVLHLRDMKWFTEWQERREAAGLDERARGLEAALAAASPPAAAGAHQDDWRTGVSLVKVQRDFMRAAKVFAKIGHKTHFPEQPMSPDFAKNWVRYYATTFPPREPNFDAQWDLQYELFQSRVARGELHEGDELLLPELSDQTYHEPPQHVDPDEEFPAWPPQPAAAQAFPSDPPAPPSLAFAPHPEASMADVLHVGEGGAGPLPGTSAGVLVVEPLDPLDPGLNTWFEPPPEADPVVAAAAPASAGVDVRPGDAAQRSPRPPADSVVTLWGGLGDEPKALGPPPESGAPEALGPHVAKGLGLREGQQLYVYTEGSRGHASAKYYSNRFESLADAVVAAEEGATIHLMPGTYRSLVLLNPPDKLTVQSYLIHSPAIIEGTSGIVVKGAANITFCDLVFKVTPVPPQF